MQLTEIIIDKIQKEGPLSFHDFMEMSLYYPELGYYTSERNPIGTTGDFYTSPNLTPLFGTMIGKQLEEMWEATGKGKFTIVEYGAGTGKLCHDIMNYLKNNPDFYKRLTYCIIEKNSARQENKTDPLNKKISWYDAHDVLPEITGCILSNESVDNFSVHQVVMEEELQEVFVDYKEGFVELLRPASEELKNYLEELNIILPKDFRTEINLHAIPWIKEISKCLKKGYVITIDYGYTASQLYSHQRRSGTLMCYHKHSLEENPYDNIGSQDITTHVNFSALCHWGAKNGLSCCGLTNQARFLLSLGFKEELRKATMSNEDPIRAIKEEAFLTHTLLFDMGVRFKVLIQEKGIGKKALLGLKFL